MGRRKWIVLALAAVTGIVVGGALALLHPRHPAAVSLASVQTAPNETWPAGGRRAPEFRLRDQNGTPVSLASFRGRPVIVTFIDPLCRNLCPREAKVLNDVVTGFPPATRPAIVAVSVNPWGNARAHLLQDVRKWHLVPEWHWGVGGSTQLASVWRRYKIGVLVTTKHIAGIRVREITHTEAAYVVDSAGYQRALYLYPFSASDVVRTLQGLAPARSS